jgi:hypothetical protein
MDAFAGAEANAAQSKRSSKQFSQETLQSQNYGKPTRPAVPMRGPEAGVSRKFNFDGGILLLSIF